MIQANELRLGIYIKYLSTLTKMDEELLYLLYDKNSDLEISDFYPIEITEEILLNCGFEKFEDHNKYGWYLKVDNRYLCWCFNEYISLEFTENQAYLNYNDTLFDYPCKYLHQLQNLYYALCNEELNIQL